MQKSSPIALGALFLVALAALITIGALRHGSIEQKPLVLPPAATSVASIPSSGFAPNPQNNSFGVPAHSLSTLSLLDKLPPTKPLASSAPRSIRFGVILVTHCEAQFAPDPCRSRAEALALARSLHEIAIKDFKEAVKKGDPGSDEDKGEIRQNILEPVAEAEIFSLPVGGVSSVIDYPRGYWIVRRIK